MFSRTMLANLLSRSLTVSMCILFAVLAAAFLSGGPANSHEGRTRLGAGRRSALSCRDPLLSPGV